MISIYYEVLITSIDLLWKILAPFIPNKLPAGHLRSVCATFISGIHPDTKQFYIQAEPLAGGWGASATHDGNRGQLSCGSGESYNIPIEIREMRYGIQVEQYAFHNEERIWRISRKGRTISEPTKLYLMEHIRDSGIFKTKKTKNMGRIREGSCWRIPPQLFQNNKKKRQRGTP